MRHTDCSFLYIAVLDPRTGSKLDIARPPRINSNNNSDHCWPIQRHWRLRLRPQVVVPATTSGQSYHPGADGWAPSAAATRMRMRNEDSFRTRTTTTFPQAQQSFCSCYLQPATNMVSLLRSVPRNFLGDHTTATTKESDQIRDATMDHRP
jgi:hypothetical protein